MLANTIDSTARPLVSRLASESHRHVSRGSLRGARPHITPHAKQTFQPTAIIPMAGNGRTESKRFLYTRRLVHLEISSRNTHLEIQPHQGGRVALRVCTTKDTDNGWIRYSSSSVSCRPSDSGCSAGFEHSTAREHSNQTNITGIDWLGNFHQQRWKTNGASRTMETRTDPGPRKFWYGMLGSKVIDIRSCTSR